VGLVLAVVVCPIVLEAVVSCGNGGRKRGRCGQGKEGVVEVLVQPGGANGPSLIMSCQTRKRKWKALIFMVQRIDSCIPIKT
jgi:hypothetical protein